MPEGVDDLLLPEALVTGEAVVLDLRPASFASRALAYVLDLLIIIALAIVLNFYNNHTSVDVDAAEELKG